MGDPIYIGVSRCLLGDEVRYDGGHKRDALLIERLGPHVQWLPVCPEVEVGMGTPREPIDLESDAGGRLRLIAVHTRRDWTEPMEQWAAARIGGFDAARLAGFVLKSNSPSCGVERDGLFARALTRALPNLPVEEDDRLGVDALRDNFVERIFAYARARRLFATEWTAGDLVRFHTAHKMQLLAHSRIYYTELGRLVAAGAGLTREALADRYEAVFMAALREPAQSGRHADALRHMAGHLKDAVSTSDRQAIDRVVDDYRRAAVPLGVPLATIRGYARRYRVTYLERQTYLNPDPREVQLRGELAALG